MSSGGSRWWLCPINTAIIKPWPVSTTAVIEPGWEPGHSHWNHRRQVWRVVSHLLGMWRQRDRLVQATRAKLASTTSAPTIFYDADMIKGTKEVIRLCPDCPGFVILTHRLSRAMTGCRPLYCPSHPGVFHLLSRGNGCFHGTEAARRYDYVLLQDVHDRYERYQDNERRALSFGLGLRICAGEEDSMPKAGSTARV